MERCKHDADAYDCDKCKNERRRQWWGLTDTPNLCLDCLGDGCGRCQMTGYKGGREP